MIGILKGKNFCILPYHGNKGSLILATIRGVEKSLVKTRPQNMIFNKTGKENWEKTRRKDDKEEGKKRRGMK